MVSSRKLIKMVRKWKRLAAISRKTITFPRSKKGADAEICSTSTVDKGHFVMYTADQRRFVIPLAYLVNGIFRELLKMAEEEYGLPGDGPITLPCDAIFMDYAVSLVRRHVTNDMEEALLVSISTRRCLPSSYHQQEQSSHQLQIFSF